MALPILPIAIAVIAVAALGATGGKKRRRSQQAPAQPLPGNQWLEPGDPCDPVDPAGVPPGHGCYLTDSGHVVLEDHDPMTKKAVDYGEFGDDQGVAEALDLLGFSQKNFQQRVASFQEYAYDYFGLSDGALRLDGRVDANTIGHLKSAIDDFEKGTWVSLSQNQEEEVFREFEVDNAADIVDAWQQDPLYIWEFDDGDTIEPVENQPLSAWLSNIVYWGTYGVGSPDSDAPKTFFPVPFTDQWEAETHYREAWLRIQDHVKFFMEQAGVQNVAL